MLLRFEQGTSYYGEFPWNVPRLMTFMLVTEGERELAIRESRAFAASLLRFKDCEPSTYADRLFSGHLFEALTKWSTGEHTVMDEDLFRELLSHSLCLTAMQRLESRHHLVHQQASPARAGTAAYISANLRRKQNRDLKEASFRSNCEGYLQRFSELVPEPWTTKCELAKLVSGHALSIMFADTSREDALVAAMNVRPPPRMENALIYQDHLKLTLNVGEYYAVPISSDHDSTSYVLVQLVDTRPAGKRYIQRTLGWSTDAWHDHVAVLMTGTYVAHKADQSMALAPLPKDFQHDFRDVDCAMTAFPLLNFFHFDFEHLYRLGTVSHECNLSMDQVLTALDDEDEVEDAVSPALL